MIKVSGIGGVFVYADDAKALADWYAAHLGIAFLYNEAENNYYMEFPYREDADPAKRQSTVFAIMPAPHPPGPARNQCMINYRVDDLDRFIAQLAGQHITAEGLEEYSYGRFTWIHDPEGNRIELYQPLDPG